MMVKMIKFFIEADPKRFNLNNQTNTSRGNKYFANNNKKKFENEIILQLIKQGVKKINTPCTIKAVWHLKHKRMDLDNLLLKNVLDALQKIDLLENDNLNHVVEINHRFVIDKEKQGLELKIKEEIK